jgi:hypothetical protein
LTSTHNFIQTAGIRDVASHCAKILSVFYDNLDTSDHNDPEVIIKIDISHAFTSTCRALTLDVLSGRASRQIRLQGQCISPSSTWGEDSFWARFPGWCISAAGGCSPLSSAA